MGRQLDPDTFSPAKRGFVIKFMVADDARPASLSRAGLIGNWGDVI
jgi:hypothetical protein